MQVDELYRKLIAAARAYRPSDQVPYAFEKRILAQLTLRPVVDTGAEWARALWRAVVPCLAVVILLSVWALVAPGSGSASGDLSQDFVATVLAPVTQDMD
jgi:hypothetical protein